MSRARKIFYGFCLGAVAVIYATVSEMDYQDQVAHEKYVAEINARQLLNKEFPEEYRPAMSASPAFVGKPSGKFYEEEYARLREKHEAKRRARWAGKVL